MASSKQMNPIAEIPVIWAPVGNELVAIAESTQPIEGWTKIASPELGRALGKYLQRAGRGIDQVQVRTFTMREVDLPFWDSAVRKGSGGYSYGTVWGNDSKILKNLQIKEVATQPVQAPAIDPAMLAVAVALHQVQQSLARMEAQLETIQAAVEWLEHRRQSKQAAELLTAATTLASVGRRCMTSGTVHPEDILRVAHLEQVAGTVHREIAMELNAIANKLSFENVKDAKDALNLKAERVVELLKLDRYALEALATYQRLLLTSKVANGRLTAGEVEETKAELVRTANATIEVVKHLRMIDSHMRDRSIWDYMMTTGYFKGKYDDDRLRERAVGHRVQVQREAKKGVAGVRCFRASVESLDVFALDRHEPLALVNAQAAPA